jgi:hypothetical protein
LLVGTKALALFSCAPNSIVTPKRTPSIAPRQSHFDVEIPLNRDRKFPTPITGRGSAAVIVHKIIHFGAALAFRGANNLPRNEFVEIVR